MTISNKSVMIQTGALNRLLLSERYRKELHVAYRSNFADGLCIIAGFSHSGSTAGRCAGRLPRNDLVLSALVGLLCLAYVGGHESWLFVYE